jgi:NADPH:quinone reductase
LSETWPVENLVIEDLPLPLEREGWVRIRIEAFGLNRSELMTRLGLSGDAVTFPRVLGIECAGVVDAAPTGTGLEPGQQVVAMMGGMGRTYDGSYAEYMRRGVAKSGDAPRCPTARTSGRTSHRGVGVRLREL